MVVLGYLLPVILLKEEKLNTTRDFIFFPFLFGVAFFCVPRKKLDRLGRCNLSVKDGSGSLKKVISIKDQVLQS